ncbi:MAG: RNA methyltransferase [Pseudomonadota bacterium]
MPLLDSSSSPLPPPDARLTSEFIVQSLAPFLSPKRRGRIERTINQRLISVTVVLEDLYDPHNGAAVLRTCEAMGLFHVHVIPNRSGFRFAHQVTQRADKWLNVYLHSNTKECFRYLKKAGFRCIGAFPPPVGNAPEPPIVPVDKPLAIIFGNEHTGLSEKAKAYCDGVFHLPMFGFSESLNLSVSVALALQDVTNRRRHFIGRTGDFPLKARQHLRAAYYAHSTRHAADLILSNLRNQE